MIHMEVSKGFFTEYFDLCKKYDVVDTRCLDMDTEQFGSVQIYKMAYLDEGRVLYFMYSGCGLVPCQNGCNEDDCDE